MAVSAGPAAWFTFPRQGRVPKIHHIPACRFAEASPPCPPAADPRFPFHPDRSVPVATMNDSESSSPSTPPLPGPAGEPAVTDFAAALGRIPSGLFVVTWRVDGADRGMLASWVMQAGFEPPLISLAVGTSRELLAALRGGEAFVVNVLAESQRGLLARFGRPPGAGEDPFLGLAVERTIGEVAALAEAAAWLACRPVAESVPVGADHAVVLGRVEAARGRPSERPLIHLRRNGLKYS